jgi:hypothetical protein
MVAVIHSARREPGNRRTHNFSAQRNWKTFDGEPSVCRRTIGPRLEDFRPLLLRSATGWPRH